MAGAIRTDDQAPPLASYDADRVVNYVLDVFIQDAVLSRAVRDLHDKVTLSILCVKVSLSRRTSRLVPSRSHDELSRDCFDAG